MKWAYGINIIKEGNDFVVYVRDLPEVCTSGNSLEQALELAEDAIDVIVSWRIDEEQPLPLPSEVLRGEFEIFLTPQLAAKACIYHLWSKKGISKVELARIIGKTETEARRILSTKSKTKIEQLNEAARALGARLVVGFAA